MEITFEALLGSSNSKPRLRIELTPTLFAKWALGVNYKLGARGLEHLAA